MTEDDLPVRPVPLPRAFLVAPIAHRALHDLAEGRPENSRAAVRAAIEAGYGIEIDVQLSADGEAMVFHDPALDRLTDAHGPVRARTAAQLAVIPLKGDGEGIPTLAEILRLVAGRVPLLIEIKDQDGAMGEDVGPLEAAVARALEGYEGPVAVMSFNPHAMAAMARLAPGIARGLTTHAWDDPDSALLEHDHRAHLAVIGDFDRVGASFISHDAHDLDNPRVKALKEAGVPVLTWTVRSPDEEAEARRQADNITFEGYAARRPG
ncbi:MAG: phosphodiesterase [Alphaproteobacteria bacterium]|nr:MAG: phosphodiesterase [Alphaproteobacteria bacterium]